jgi:UDP-N-acetylglucosamine acyltransferase
LPQIHPLAYVELGAELADDVVVGPFSYVESGVQIGSGCVLESHVTIRKWTVVGENNVFSQGSVIGGDPQAIQYKGQKTLLVIGNNNIFREYSTVHRSMFEGKSTIIGDHCMLMAYAHVAHDCNVYNHVTIANAVSVAGHVTIEERAFIGGMCGIHQWCRIGKVAMVGGFSKITRDVPPFTLVDGANEEVRDINAIGMRRLGINQDSRLALHKAIKLLFKSKIGLTSALELVREEVPQTDEVRYLIAFEERRFGGRNGRGDQR